MNQKGFTLITLLIGVLVIILVGGLYYALKYNSFIPKDIVNKPNPSSTPYATIQLYPLPTAPLPDTSFDTLKDFLTYCNQLSDKTLVNINSLPVKIKEKIILNDRSNTPYNSIICWSNYLEIPFKENLANKVQKYYIYEKPSDDNEGHGGPLRTGLLGRTILSQDNITLNIYLPTSELGSPIGQVPLILRGQKQLYTAKGTIFYVNTERVIIAKDDPRLINILRSYGKPEKENDTNELEVTDLKTAEEQLAKQLFANINTLGEKEAEAIRIINSDLAAIESNI